MRTVDPVKYYSDEGFVEHKIELGDEDLEEMESTKKAGVSCCEGSLLGTGNRN
jgi:hypothetical protein